MGQPSAAASPRSVILCYDRTFLAHLLSVVLSVQITGDDVAAQLENQNRLTQQQLSAMKGEIWPTFADI